MDAPDAFKVDDRQVLLLTHAVGAQIYECKTDISGGMNWVFREPIAALFGDGETVGRHYVGPAWELAEGDIVEGKQVAVAPGATSDDLALLKLDILKNSGNGILKNATLVLRLNTRGGVLKGVCQTAGEFRAEPYSADYVFLQ
ncbi:DUF3455 domain-containing protein [Mesorhizobium sp.]|uniref:DUF3455 domain-containing protein n=1 Tax=Mesorhizobium sp. TaxID=1871066 RepID=UPI0025F16E68|nr:DUF3455 domain-containing protein [Mesorhizobium sp.]